MLQSFLSIFRRISCFSALNLIYKRLPTADFSLSIYSSFLFLVIFAMNAGRTSSRLNPSGAHATKSTADGRRVKRDKLTAGDVGRLGRA